MNSGRQLSRSLRQLRSGLHWLSLAAIVFGLHVPAAASTAFAQPAAPEAETVSTSPAIAGTKDRADLPQILRYRLSEEIGRGDTAYSFVVNEAGAFSTTHPKMGYSAQSTGFDLSISQGAATWQTSLAWWGRTDNQIHTRTGSTVLSSNRMTSSADGAATWLTNGPLGLQQGWTFSIRPDGTGPLSLALASNGTLQPVLNAGGLGVTLVDTSREERFVYRGLLAFDAAGRELPARMKVAGPGIVITVDDASAVYPVTVDPILQVAKLTASDASDFDQLGKSIAISGDGKTIVAGAPSGDNETPSDDKGALYVFHRPDSTWVTGTQTTKLWGTPSSMGDALGNSVAVNTDGSVIVGGANGLSGGLESRGAAYLFQRPGATWPVTATQTSILTPTLAVAGDQVGVSVSVSGDGLTVVVGASGDTAATNKGAAYVFQRPGAAWPAVKNMDAKLTASNGALADQFGASVAISRDGLTIAAGAPFAANGGTGRGAVYVYQRPGSGTWATGTENAILSITGSVDSQNLGNGVAVDATGKTIAAGAPGAANGLVAVYVRTGANWATGTQTAKLTASAPGGSDQLGGSVAIDDAGTEILACAEGVNTGTGKAFVFTIDNPGWADATELVTLNPSDGAANEAFARSVAMSADSTIQVVAGYRRAGGGIERGAAYVYRPPTIISFAPTSAAQGATVTITGASLISTTAVSFGGIPAASFSVISSTRVTAVVGAGATGVLTITSSDGFEASLAGFTYLSPIVNLGFTTSPTPTADSRVVFTPTVDSGTNITYTWTFGDEVAGSSVGAAGFQTFAAGPAITHTYKAPGSYTVTVRAQNVVSNVQASKVVVVAPNPGTLRVNVPLVCVLCSPTSSNVTPTIPSTPGAWSAATPIAGVGFHAVAFSNNTTAWAVGTGGNVYKTTDSGATWSKVNGMNTTQDLYGVQFFNESYGIIVGRGGTIRRTADSGATWQTVTSPTNGDLGFGISLVSAQVGWISGNGGTILKTTNGGTSWTAQSSGFGGDLGGIFFVDENKGWAAGNQGIILATTNGGTTWTRQKQPTNDQDSLSRIYFQDALKGWAVGDPNTNPLRSNLWRTTDGGANWARVTVPIAGPALSQIVFVDGNRAWIAAEERIILRTVDGGATWTVEVQESKPAGQHLWMFGVDARSDGSAISVGSAYPNNGSFTPIESVIMRRTAGQ